MRFDILPWSLLFVRARSKSCDHPLFHFRAHFFKRATTWRRACWAVFPRWISERARPLTLLDFLLLRIFLFLGSFKGEQSSDSLFPIFYKHAFFGIKKSNGRHAHTARFDLEILFYFSTKIPIYTFFFIRFFVSFCFLEFCSFLRIYFIISYGGFIIRLVHGPGQSRKSQKFRFFYFISSVIINRKIMNGWVGETHRRNFSRLCGTGVFERRFITKNACYIIYLPSLTVRKFTDRFGIEIRLNWRFFIKKLRMAIPVQHFFGAGIRRQKSDREILIGKGLHYE